MRSVFNYVVEPVGSRYNNTKKIDGNDLILNTQIFTHQSVNRLAVVKHVPIIGNHKIQVGDHVIVHHNVFRRFHDIRGIEKNSKSYIDENNYLCGIDQVYAYKKTKWMPTEGYAFVKPIQSNYIFSTSKEQPLKGILKIVQDNPHLKEGDLVGFTPNSEYEFVIDGERLYRVRSKNLTIKYEHQGNEKEYNPSWA
jgi:hypothetical protein